MDIHDAVDGIIDKARGEAIMRNAVTLARNAVDSKGDGLVALSLGPYGATMRPSTEYTACYDSHHSTQERLRKWHLDRLLIYASDPATWERIDCVAFETFGRTDEILAARKAMDDLVTIKGLPPKKFWISCVFVEIDGQVVLPSGETPKKALQSVLRPVMRDDNSVLPRPWGIGINCTKVGRVRGILKEWVQEIEGVVSGNVEWPTLVLYPDGTGEGERYDSVRREWVVEGQSKKEEGTWAERVAQLAREVKESEESGTARWAGVVVGGCCRIGPEDIKRLSHELLKKSS